jgi:hypothetical protein
MSDNVTTVAYINAMGGIKSSDCNNMALQIWQWSSHRNIWLSSCHIPGSTNVVADKESRELDGSTEWSLNTEVFEDINRLWGPFQIDLFASRLNYKVTVYASWKPDPETKYVNSFYMNWGNYYFYSFPPFQYDCHLPTENRIRPSNRCSSSAFVANPTLVHNSFASTSRQTTPLSSV